MKLDNGDTITISGALSEAQARQIVQEAIENGTTAQRAGRPIETSTAKRCAGREIDDIQVIERRRRA
ncbi:hypothetical protein ACH4FX_06880 [Streptomyces sp. NPDC018019]|uniref:hypothetical protein n=1 Tax=Streptomyces sp. NPDC018019 TaxID=3365030 RepID=UPI00379C638E